MFICSRILKLTISASDLDNMKDDIRFTALVVWPWYIKDLRQFKLYYHHAKKAISREQQSTGTSRCWIVLYRLPLFPWTLFISVKASAHNKHLKTKFKNITEWWALQPTHLFSHYFFLLIQYTANLIALITLARAATKSGSHHALLPPHSVAFGVTYHCLLPCVVTSISPWTAIEEKQLSRSGSYM